MFDFENELKNLPELPGVYIMHNKDKRVIYVGKAKILKNRVRQYFQKNASHSAKVRAMVSNIATVYITAEDGCVYKGYLEADESLILIRQGDKLSVKYVESEIDKIYIISEWNFLETEE